VQPLDGDRSIRPPGESPEQVFRLSPLRPGEAVLRFEQRRPWEPDADPHDTRTFEVVIEE
jgi:hypothetical protein